MVRLFNYTAALLRLVRWPNLVIVALTQILVRQCLIVPILKRFSMEPQLPVAGFVMLVAATVLITAGGYAINDYFDRKIDRVNRPNEIIVGSLVYPRHAMACHMILSVTGVILGIWAAYIAGYLYLSLVFFMASGLLWFYSTTYKREFLLGNIIVALLTALVPFLVLFFELPLMASQYGIYAGRVTRLLMTWVLGFSLFAFLINMVREIVKDSEDFEGDQAYGKKTVPVLWGIRTANIICIVIVGCTIALLATVWYLFIRDNITAAYFILLLIMPLLIVAGMLVKSIDQQKLHRISTWLKIVMLSGLGYMIVANLIMNSLK